MDFIKKYKLYFIIILLIIIGISIFILSINNKTINKSNDKKNNTNNSTSNNEELGYIKDNVVISDVDGNNINYSFIYNEETYTAVYTTDNWKIYDSYKIKNANDIKKICQALIYIHPVHGNEEHQRDHHQRQKRQGHIENDHGGHHADDCHHA